MNEQAANLTGINEKSNDMGGQIYVAMLYYVTPKEHLGLPNRDDVKAGVITYSWRRMRPILLRGTRRRSFATMRSARPASTSAGRTSSTSASTRTARAMHDETLPKETHKVAHFCSMCGPKFCSMEITQQVREYAATLNETPEAAAEQGMAEMSEKFRASGGKIYVEPCDNRDT